MELEAKLYHTMAHTSELTPLVMLDVKAPRFRTDFPLAKPGRREQSPEFIIERRGRPPVENVRMRSNSPFHRDRSPQAERGIFFTEIPTELRAQLQANGVHHQLD
jgi:hypothetical protein